MASDEFLKCTSIRQYLEVVAGIEGYRSIRELFCNYLSNFGYTVNDFKLHLEYRHSVYYSIASCRAAHDKATRKPTPLKSPKQHGFKYRKTAVKYNLITRECLGYRTFREAIYHLTIHEGLNYRQIAQLYGVSKGALQYRVKQAQRSKS